MKTEEEIVSLVRPGTWMLVKFPVVWSGKKIEGLVQVMTADAGLYTVLSSSGPAATDCVLIRLLETHDRIAILDETLR